MSQNHPSQFFLDQLANGDLEDTISIVVSSHTENCKQCQEYLAKKEENLANILFNSSDKIASQIPDFSHLQEAILAKPKGIDASPKSPQVDNAVVFKHQTIDLPHSLRNIKKYMSPWKSFGNISYSKLNVRGSSSMYFVHFEPGVKISEHSHEGNEFAYVIAGSFQDQHNEYITGDFASFNHDVSHHPYTEDPDGCLLLVSIDGPFVFKEGWARLLNPFRNLFFKKL